MRNRTVFLLPLISGLFLFGFFANVWNGEVTLGNSLIQWGIALALIPIFLFVRREERRRVELLVYLAGHRDAVRSGTASHGGQTLSYATRVRVYHVVLSFLFITIRLPSRLVIHRSGPDFRIRAACSACSLVLGWWGFPWGPIWTIKAVFNNLRGAPELTLGEILDGKSSIPVPPARARRSA